MRVIYAPAAIRDIQRLREFLQAKNPLAARRAGQAILKSLRILGHQPKLGRPVEDLPPDYREWLIDFGNSGYIARYRFDEDQVVVLAVRHQKGRRLLKFFLVSA